MIDLTEQEKTLIINALQLAPISGNAKEVRSVLVRIEGIIQKLTAVTPSENGQVEKKEAVADG